MEPPESTASGNIRMVQANDKESITTSDPHEDFSSRIIHLLQRCWVRRRMAFGILATGILVSLLYALSLPNMYTSTTTLMPSDSVSSSSNLMSLLSSAGPAASIGSSALGVKTPGAIFVGIMGSRTVQESLVKQFDLVHHYKVPLIEDACKRLEADSQIVEDVKSGIISIRVNARNPMLASNIAQGYVEELNRVVTNNSTSAVRRERIFLEERLKGIKLDLDDSAKALSQFSTKSRTIDIPSQGRAMVDSGLRLQDQMVLARSELAGLRQSYSEDNVRIRAARARIAELQRQIDKTMGTSEEPRLDANDSAYPSVSELPALGLTYSDFDRRMRIEEALWDTLTRQYEAARVQEAKEIPTVRVLDVANVPQRKSSPARGKIVLSGAMLSLLIAYIIVITTSWWEHIDSHDERKRSVAAVVNAIQHPQRWFWPLL